MKVETMKLEITTDPEGLIESFKDWYDPFVEECTLEKQFDEFFFSEFSRFVEYTLIGGE